MGGALNGAESFTAESLAPGAAADLWQVVVG